MVSKYIIRKRQNTILYTEIFIASIITSVLLVIYFKLHPAIGLLIGLVSIFIFIYLFFAYRIFRYTFSIIFSIGWSYAAFLAGKEFDEKSTTTSWVFAIISFLISIWAHWDHFTFLKNAKVYEYEKQ